MVGDVMFDAFVQNLESARASCRVLEDLGLEPGSYQLMTIHRAENTDDPTRLEAILNGLSASGKHAVWPIHPRARDVLKRTGIKAPDNVRVIEPAGYLEMLILEDGAEAIVTDSGGVQKEAYFAGKPCITVRERTEWIETVDAGWNVLVGSDSSAIAEAMRGFRPTTPRPPLFGDGRAAERVVEALDNMSVDWSS
jgi:UDP-N-acetylglucosamine 2-epimerase (non-hydrolysing)/UDP-GlcNAc3NAcA epimerase